jgi:hypothetical protein
MSDGPKPKEPGSDELLSSEAAIKIQDEIWESEKAEDADTDEFNAWYRKNQDDWETDEADV